VTASSRKRCRGDERRLIEEKRRTRHLAQLRRTDPFPATSVGSLGTPFFSSPSLLLCSMSPLSAQKSKPGSAVSRTVTAESRQFTTSSPAGHKSSTASRSSFHCSIYLTQPRNTKLYKKLSKAAATAAETQPGHPHPRPRNSDSRPHCCSLKPRVVESTAPLAL